MPATKIKSRKTATEECWRLSIGQWVAARADGHAETGSLRMEGEVSGEIPPIVSYWLGTGADDACWLMCEYVRINETKLVTVKLARSPMVWQGGHRWWYRCPQCVERVGKLYIPPGGDRLLCRTCHGLTYLSCQERTLETALSP